MIFLVDHYLRENVRRCLVKFVEVVLFGRWFLSDVRLAQREIPKTRTSTVAMLGLTVFILPSLPIMASHIWSHGGVSSSSTTMNNGLSQRVMPLGSSYRKMRFSKTSSSYPPSVSLSAKSFLLFSRHRSGGVPTCSSRTVSALTRKRQCCTDDAAGGLQGFGLAVQLVAKALDVVQAICDNDVIP